MRVPRPASRSPSRPWSPARGWSLTLPQRPSPCALTRLPAPKLWEAAATARSGRPEEPREAGSGRAGARFPEAAACLLGSRRADRRGGRSSSISIRASPSRRPAARTAGEMLPVHTEVKPNPLQDANLCSRVFFW